VFCEYFLGGGGGWLAQSHVFYDGGVLLAVTHCHKGVGRAKNLAKTASRIL
jgi:hypothetical protein